MHLQDSGLEIRVVPSPSCAAIGYRGPAARLPVMALASQSLLVVFVDDQIINPHRSYRPSGGLPMVKPRIRLSWMCLQLSGARGVDIGGVRVDVVGYEYRTQMSTAPVRGSSSSSVYMKHSVIQCGSLCHSYCFLALRLRYWALFFRLILSFSQIYIYIYLFTHTFLVFRDDHFALYEFILKTQGYRYQRLRNVNGNI